MQVLSLMDYQNRITSIELAREAQQTAATTQKLTEDMRSMAQKTEVETIFMRIVTAVTMFFLPGTFVSVCSCNQLPQKMADMHHRRS